MVRPFIYFRWTPTVIFFYVFWHGVQVSSSMNRIESALSPSMKRFISLALSHVVPGGLIALDLQAAAVAAKLE